jgi:hypothetical protein
VQVASTQSRAVSPSAEQIAILKRKKKKARRAAEKKHAEEHAAQARRDDLLKLKAASKQKEREAKAKATTRSQKQVRKAGTDTDTDTECKKKPDQWVEPEAPARPPGRRLGCPSSPAPSSHQTHREAAAAWRGPACLRASP